MFHSHGQLPVNPNSNRNRVPEGAELASLRATASHLQSVIDHNTQAAEAAFKRYEEIKARYDAHALILEEIGSELYAAKLLADVLEEQASSLEPKLQELRGLLNPIRRYSDDILRLIFEEYVADRLKFDWDGFVAATLLSHVCRRWRILALSTPSIWTRIFFKPQPSAEASVSRASAFFDRVKASPTTIHIDINGDTPGSTAKIPFTMIYRVPVISDLVLRIHGDPVAAFDAVKAFPKRHIDRLEFITFIQDPIHFGPFLSKFRTFRQLEAGYVEFGSFIWPNLSDALSKLEEIHFLCVNEVPIIDLLSLAPQLRSLKMHQCHVRRDSDGGIDQCTPLNLRHLYTKCEGVPWSKIRAPSLVEFETGLLPGAGDSDGFWNFLSQSCAITDMICGAPTPEQIVLLTGLAPKVRSLTLECTHSITMVSILMALDGSLLSSPPLPGLEHLTFTCEPEDLEVATIEAFIRSRCLLRGHPESTMYDGISQALSLLEIRTRYGGAGWTLTPFLEKHLVRADSNTFVYQAVGQA